MWWWLVMTWNFCTWVAPLWRDPMVKELLSSFFPPILYFSQVSPIFKNSTCFILFISSSKFLILLLAFSPSKCFFISSFYFFSHASYFYSFMLLFLLFIKCLILICIIVLILERIHPQNLKPLIWFFLKVFMI